MAFPYLSPKGQRTVVAAVAVAAAFLFGTQYTGKVDESQFAQATHDALVASCEKNGNPLREGVREMLRSDIEQRERSLRTGQIYELLPGSPRQPLRHAVKVAIWKRQQILNQIQPVPCDEAFPRP